MAVDNWEHIVKLLTGWSLPERSEVTGVKGDSGIPWLNVDVKKVAVTMQPRTELRDTGASFQFYVPKGKDMNMYEANINYADLSSGDTYVQRSQEALSRLVNEFRTTGVQSTSGGEPTGTDGVDMRSFAKAARSFDVAGQFFYHHEAVLKHWLDHLGDENAAWKGTAAGVFYNLVKDLHDKYDHFLAQLRPPGFQPQYQSAATPGFASTTLHGDQIIGAENMLHQAHTKLLQQFGDFYWRRGRPVTVNEADGQSISRVPPAHPKSVLNELMWDVDWFIKQYNTSRIQAIKRTVQRADDPDVITWRTLAGFSTRPHWGDLRDTSTWSGIAQEAVTRWTNNLKANLDEPALPVITELSQGWSRVLDPTWNTRFAFEDIPSISLADTLQQDIAERQQEEALHQQKEALQQQEDGQEEFARQFTNFQQGVDSLGKDFQDLGDGLDGFGNSVGGLSRDFGNSFAAVDAPDPSTLVSSTPETPAVNGPAAATDLPTAGGLDGSGLTTVSTPSALTENGFGANGLGTDGTTAGLSGLTGGDSLTSAVPTPGTLDTTTVQTPTTLDATALPTDTTGLSADATGLPTDTTLNASDPFATDTPTVTGADATTTATGLGAVPLLTYPSASTQNLTTNGPGKTNSDGSTVVPGADGGLVSQFPDGSSVVVGPDGTVTTTSPDGQTTTDVLGPGEVVTNPDGSTIGLDPDGGVSMHLPDGSSFTSDPDGSVTTTQPDGSSVTQFPNGTTQTVGPDGQVQLTGPDGSTVVQNPDGSVTTTFPDGGVSTVAPDGTVTSVTPQGQTVSTHLDPGQSVVNPDGSTTSLGADGSVTTTLPDGGTYTLHPDGTVTTTDPDGTTGPTGLSNLPTVSGDLGQLTTLDPDGSTTVHYPSGTTATTGTDGFTTTTFPDGSSTVAGPDGQFQTLPSPTTAGLTDATTGTTGDRTEAFVDPNQAFGSREAAAAGQSATATGTGTGMGADSSLSGMLSPMMMMGMARMGQQGNREQERIREVYGDDESDGVFFPNQQQSRPVGRPEPDAYEEEEEDSEELLARPARSQGGPGGYARPSTSSPGWSDDGDDVWGTEEGGLPASIGR
ncbi:AAWKG family protein [Streptomyces sp. SAI-229]|uniref:AAWKG family protein n=1 Tax=Streptomyces sp. SAI-229 TaxID=3377731 RepID=UPI003C7AB237